MLTRIHDPERGASFVEYAAVITLVVAILTVLVNAAVSERIATMLQDGIGAVASGAHPDGSGDSSSSDGSENGRRDDGPQGGNDDGSAVGAPADWQFSAGPPEDGVASPLGLGDPGGITTGFHPGGYRVEEVGFGEWASETADQTRGFGDELWSIGEDTWEDAKDAVTHPIETAKQGVKETKDWAQREYEEFKSSAKEAGARFWDNWNNKGPISAGWGLAKDWAYYLNMESPIGVRDIFFPESVRDPWNEGEYGRSVAQFGVNAASYAFMPLKGLRLLPDGPKGGGKGGKGDSDSSEDQGQQKDEDKDGVTCASNSFVPGTGVLMADGSTAPIESIGVGDEVWAFDPLTGEEGPRPVTATIVGQGEKTLVDITVKNEGGTAATVTATDEHPFWVPDSAEWVEALDLTPGTWLRTAAGTWEQVAAVTSKPTVTQAHNLTVAGLHTYYVVASEQPLLVHNDLPCGDEAKERYSLDYVPVKHNELYLGKGSKYKEQAKQNEGIHLGNSPRFERDFKEVVNDPQARIHFDVSALPGDTLQDKIDRVTQDYKMVEKYLPDHKSDDGFVSPRGDIGFTEWELYYLSQNNLLDKVEFSGI